MEESKSILLAMAGSVATSRFVGRAVELGRLQAAFEYVGGGEPVTMCVGGEAGVGKTRLVTQFAAQVSGSGGRVLLGGCIELAEASLPYAPVVEALRGLGRGLKPADLDELVGAGRPMLARLLPEFGQDEELTGAALAVGSSAQARLFEAFLAVLERLADRSPTVLIVEDLHWADRSTLDLLTFLVRNLRAALLLVLTYRDDELHRRHPLRPFLAGVDRSSRVERLEVSRFDLIETADLLAGILGARPDDELVGRIYRRSEGNAFFTEELLAATHQSGGRSLPPSLENVLLSRVQDLPEDAQATLRLVAAASGPVEAELLAAVSELPDADLVAGLRAAVAHQVLVPDPDTETLAFRHALTQEALYAELLPGERARLHARFAQALTDHPELATADPRAAPARLAYHWVRAHDPGRALPAAVQAGLQSVAAYGFADAQRHFETALELWDQVADAGERVGRDHVEVVQLAAESAYLAGDPNRAITLTRVALLEVDAARDPVRAGLLHGRLGGYLHATGGEGALGEYEAAVRLVPPSPPLGVRAQVLAAYGEALIGQGHYRESQGLCEEAITIARQVGALAEEGDARRVLGVDLAFLGDLAAGVEQLMQARRIAQAVGKVDDVARAFAVLSSLLDAFGELKAAVAVALDGAEQAGSQGLGRWHSPFLTATAGRALFALGRWDEADVLLQRAADEVAPELAAMCVYIHTALSQLELRRGRARSAAEHLTLAREAYALTVTQPWIASPLFAATAELAIADRRLDDARAAVAEGLRLSGADVVFSAQLYALGLREAADRAELADAHRDDDETREARRVGGALAAELRARMSPDTADGRVPTPRTNALVALCEAELARLLGQGDPGPWAAAATAWDRLSQPYPTAYARWRTAEALLLRGTARDQVAEPLRAAHAAASELGAVSLLAEVEALGRRGRIDLQAEQTAGPVGRRRPPSSLDRLGLTEREQEVLALVAVGRTNRQIAEALFISPKTATIHVSNILAKLGVRNRVEAATIAHRLGAVEPGS